MYLKNDINGDRLMKSVIVNITLYPRKVFIYVIGKNAESNIE